jgi:hypothetical protein
MARALRACHSPCKRLARGALRADISEPRLLVVLLRARMWRIVRLETEEARFNSATSLFFFEIGTTRWNEFGVLFWEYAALIAVALCAAAKPVRLGLISGVGSAEKGRAAVCRYIFWRVFK